MFGELVNGPRPPTGIDGAPDPAGTTAAAINAMDILIPPLKPKFYSRGGAVSPLAGLTMKRRMGDIRPSMLDPDEVVFTPHQLDALRIAASAKPKLRKDQIQAIRLAHRT